MFASGTLQTTYSGPIFATGETVRRARNDARSMAGFAGQSRAYRPQTGGVGAGSRMAQYRAGIEADRRAADQIGRSQQALFDSLSIYDNVAMGLRKQGQLTEAQIKDRVHESLELVDLDDNVAEKLPSELSGGMRKRVGIARSVALRPKYLLYDEPTTGLDPVTSAVIDALMVRMQQQLGVTGIVITHDMRSAYTVGTRIAMLYEGTVRQVGSVEEIQNTTDPVVRQFIEGRPELETGAGLTR